MLLKAVDALKGTSLFTCAAAGEMTMCGVGDILVTPEAKQYRVLQRAYIAREVNPTVGSVTEIGGQKAIDFEVQLACCPVGHEAEYQKG